MTGTGGAGIGTGREGSCVSPEGCVDGRTWVQGCGICHASKIGAEGLPAGAGES
jgi:hypothetical protein